MRPTLVAAALGFLLQTDVAAFSTANLASYTKTIGHSTPSTSSRLYNSYDDWRENGITDQLPLDEETVQMCLEELVESEYGKTMFGVHDLPASVGITGEIELAEVCGPEVYLNLRGKFWHTRSHVLGRAAVWLNARMPEIMTVSVHDPDELNDFEEVIDECTGDVIEEIDRRSPDFNGDRQTMIYQGIDPDQRGPFVSSIGGDFKIIPS